MSGFEHGNPNGYPTKDWSSKSGAEELAAQIAGYWAARGVRVTTVVVDETAYRSSCFAVRSNIVNGQAPKAVRT